MTRWTIYVCEGCGWMSDSYDPDPPCQCDRDGWDETPPEVREIEAAPASDLEAAEARIRELEAELERATHEAMQGHRAISDCVANHMTREGWEALLQAIADLHAFRCEATDSELGTAIDRLYETAERIEKR